jgi:2-hydroxychromene-2-carboxylate isomerase
MAATLAFWYDFASTYSYPAAMRIERAAAAAGVRLEWRPFLLGPIFKAQGWSDSPFNLYPAKGRYMWRDLARLCARDGVAWRRPSAFPRNSLLAARVALLAAEQGWAGGFTRAAYRANFVEDRDIAQPEVIADIVAGLGQNAATVLEAAASQAVKDHLRTQSEAAMTQGIFGAPSFTIGDELFWGNDRLEPALEWAASEGVR